MPESPIVYHGTFSDFKKFDKKMMGSFTGAPSSFEGFFFATNKKVAESYASDLTKQLREYEIKADLARKEIERITGDHYFTALHKIYLHSYSAELDKKVLELNDIILKYEDLEAGIESIPMGYDYELDISGKLIKARLDLKKPFIYDMKGGEYRTVSYINLIKKAKSEGYDGLIIKNTYDGANPVGNLIITDIYVAFDDSQIKIINTKENNATETNLSTAQKYARAFGLPEEDIAHADYNIITSILTVTYGIDQPRYKQKKVTRRASKEFADFFTAPIFIGKGVDHILTAYLKAKGGVHTVRESQGISKLYYTSTNPVFGKMTLKQFIETEVKERGNYSVADVQNWIRKYGLSMNDLTIWVSPKKWVANRYNLLAEEWDKAEKIPESEMNVYEIKGNEGFIIPESDDGDEGYLFVFKRIMNPVIRESENQGTAPGQQEKINKIIEDVKKKPLRAPEKRDEIRRELTAQAGSIDQSAITELRNFRPLGMMSEFGAAMGAEPRKGVKIDTPFGPYVFDEKRVPSKERVDRWYAQHKEAEGIRTLAAEYAFGLGASPNTVTGNFRVVERGRRFKEQGMLSPEEEQALNALEKYWQEHPELDRQKGYGVWGHNLEIMVPESLRKNMTEKKGSLIDAILKASPGEVIPIEYKDVPLGKRILLPSNITGSEIQRRGDLIVVAVQVDRDIVAYLYVQKGSQLIQIRPVPWQKTQVKPGELVNTIEYNMWVERIKKEAPEYLPEWEIFTQAGIRAGDTIIHKTAKYTAVVEKIYKNGNADITVLEAKGIPEWEKSIKEGFPIKTTVKGADIDRYFEKAAINGTEAKQPWQMIRSEAIAEAAKPLGPMGISWGEMRTALSTSRQSAESLHKDMVKLAIVERKPVPPEVLKEYPDLTAKKKEPWEMTYREFADFFIDVWGEQKFTFAERVGKPMGIQSQAGEPYHMVKGKRIGYSGSLERDRWRLAIVDKALSEGKPVPSDVIAELSESLRKETEKLGETGMAEQPTKQPWQMTRDEYTKQEWWQRIYGNLTGANREASLSLHKVSIQQALEAGKQVPPEVLKDYPDLIKKEILRGTGMAEQYEEKPPGQEVRDWMRKALGIEDYKGIRHDRISMLALLIQNSELGNIRSINEAGQMARALGKDLGYGEPPAYGKSQERYYAEKIAAETGREVHIIKSSDIIKPPAKELDVQAIFDKYTAGYSKLSFKAVTYLSDLKLAMEIQDAFPEISAEGAKRLAPTIRSMAEKKYSELEEQEVKASAPAESGAIAGGTPARHILRVTEPEGYYFGTQIEVLQGANPDLEPYFTGTIKRLLNNGELVEVHPDGDPREVSFRVPVDRVNVIRLVQQEGAEPTKIKKLYRYYYLHRPPSIGTQPEGFINHESWLPAKTTPHGRTAFGWVEYDRPLTPEETSRYELFEDEVELPKLVKELVQFAHDEGIDEAMKAIDATYGRAVWDWLKSQKRLRTGVGQKEQVRDEIIRLAGITAAPPAAPPGIEKFNPEQAIKIAADSIEQLRRVDVFRVLDEYSNKSKELGDYIKSKRPDLAAEVDKILGVSQPQPKDKFAEIQDQMQRDKDKIIGEHLRELAGQMTSKEFINEALKLNKYRESYEKDPKLMNEFTNSGIQKWKELVEKHGEIGKLPDKVIEDYIQLFGEQALFSVFRGTKAKGIEGWRLPPVLIESAESLYKRYTSGYSAVSLLGIVRQESKDLAHSIGFELKLNTATYTPEVLLPIAEKFKEFAQRDFDIDHEKHEKKRLKEQAEKEMERQQGGQAFWDEVKNLKVVDFEVQHDVNPDKPTRTYYHVYDRSFAILENGKKVQVSYVIYKGEEGKRALKATKEFYMTFYGQYMGKPLSEWITYDQLMNSNRYEDYKAQQPKPRFTFIPEAPQAAPPAVTQAEQAAPAATEELNRRFGVLIGKAKSMWSIRDTQGWIDRYNDPRRSREDTIHDLEGLIQTMEIRQPAIELRYNAYISSTLLQTGALASPKFLSDERMAQDIERYIQVSKDEARSLVPQFRAIAEKRINKEEVESVKELFGIDVEQEAHKLGIDLADYAIVKAGNKVVLAHKTIVQRQYEIKSPAGFMKKQEEETQERLREAQRRKALTVPPAVPPAAKPVQSIQEVKQQVLDSIQAARSVEELQPVLKGIGFLPLPEPEKRQVMDAYQNKYSILMSERPFGVPVKGEEKPKAIGALTPQQLFEADLRRKAAEARTVSVTPTLIGGAVTSRKLEMFEPGAMEKVKAEAETRKRIEQLGLPYEVHPYIRKLAAGAQDVMKFGSKRGREAVEDIVLARYVRYCPPGTIIDNRNMPRVPERWWVYPPKLRACMSDIEKKLAEAGAGMVRESQRHRYSIYQDGRLFANEDNPTEANNIYAMLIRTFPRSVVELRENLVHPRIHQRTLKQYPVSREISVVREATQLTPSMRSYIRGAVAIRDVIHYYRDGRPPTRGVAYRARDGTYFVEAQDGQVYSSMGWEDVSIAGMPPAGRATA